MILIYKVTATVAGQVREGTLYLDGDYAVRGLDASEAQLLIDNTWEAYNEFYGDATGDETVTCGVWTDVEITFAGVA